MTIEKYLFLWNYFTPVFQKGKGHIYFIHLHSPSNNTFNLEDKLTNNESMKQSINVYTLQYSCLENPMDRGAW